MFIRYPGRFKKKLPTIRNALEMELTTDTTLEAQNSKAFQIGRSPTQTNYEILVHDFNYSHKQTHYYHYHRISAKSQQHVEEEKSTDRAQILNSHKLMSPNHLLSSSFLYSIHIYYFIVILFSKLYIAQSLSIYSANDLYPKGCLTHNNTKHDIIEPTVVIDKKQYFKQNNVTNVKSGYNLAKLSAGVNCSDNLTIYFSGFGDKFVIDLVKNKRLISDRYFKISKDNVNRHDRHPDTSSIDTAEIDDGEFYKNHLFLNLNNLTTNHDHCHYHGIVNDKLDSISAISIVDHKLLSGFFHNGSDTYYLYANTTSSSTILTKSTDLCSSNHQDGFHAKRVLESHEALIEESHYSINQTKPVEAKHRSRRSTAAKTKRSPNSSSSDNYIKYEPFQSNSSSLYVELLVVHDHSQYIEYNGNTTNIAERTMQIVNIMNAFYRQLNIFVALVGVVLWVEKDEIQLTEDGDSTLTNFLKYRYEKLLPKYYHDNAQLITNTSFNGSVVGKALKGPICTHEHSGGVNTDHSHSPAIVAVTLAHELGHNFGMEHDEDDKCKCPDEKCIMSSSSSAVHPKHWSSCSIEYLEDAKKHGLLDCLANKPEKDFGPICGNGFVEEGEDCDIGEPIPTYGTSKKSRRVNGSKCTEGQDCKPILPENPCCNRHTCKFMTNATCAQGSCCDLTTCSVYNSTEPKVCRPRYSECDLEEVCDGKSEHCPSDVYYHDGIECGPTVSSTGRQPSIGSVGYNRSRAYCYNGKCASHESQCQLLWGPTGSSSKDICYEQNIHGNTSGNCGYNRKDKLYDTCEQENAICGMLHCVHNQPGLSDSRRTGKLGYGFESASILTVSFFVMSNHAKIYCNGAIIDAGPNARDPGLVPNGAACGEDKMCLNQRCLPIYDVIYKNWCPSDCNGNGICDNMGICHCNDGTIGTSCYQFFGPNFHLSLLLYIVMFFFPMIALIVFTVHHYRNEIKLWWFLHNRKIALKDKGREQNHNRRIAYDLNHKNVTISEPIPLNQQNNVNRPFYEPPTDPWAETSCETNQTKSLGYRLEPLQNKTGYPNVTGLNQASPIGGETTNLRPG